MVETSQRRRRPFGVYAIICLQVVNLLLFLTDSSRALFGLPAMLLAGVENGALVVAINTAVIVLLLVTMIGLFRLNHMAWLLTMVLTGLGLLVGIVQYVRGAQPYLHLLANVFIVFYLNQRGVQQEFRSRQAIDEVDGWNDFVLLRTYEPTVRFTKGEMFYPCAVDDYVSHCSLWKRDANQKAQVCVRKGQLDVGTLAEYDRVPADHQFYLQYVETPLDALEYQRWLRRPERVSFETSGRLARVPLLSRIAGSLFDLSLLLRGVVPGGTAAAAEQQYRTLLTRDARRVYGRVMHAGGWIVLHYIFFYTMNNWRSGFHGANDHEADWEQVFVYLSRDDSAEPTPRWVAYASHDYKGDDLRRRWDDPALVKEATHPVIFAGAGSHSSYFEPGEYIMGAEPAFLTPVKKAILALRRFWVEQLGQGESETVTQSLTALISVPFVDYARGDGVCIGSGHDLTWDPILVSDELPWVTNYRGLWGLDVRDPFGGERAPGGPKYNRDGTMRQTWFDPLGWAGVDKLTPPEQLLSELEARSAALDAAQTALASRIDEQQYALRMLALDVDALHGAAGSSNLYSEKVGQLSQHEQELHALHAQKIKLAETRVAITAYRCEVERGASSDPRAHIRHASHPAPPLPPQRRVVEIWAAMSGAVALFILMGLLIMTPPHWPLWVLLVAVLFVGVEATTRGRLDNFLLNTSIVLAMIASLILIWEFWQVLAILALMCVVVYINSR